jgi:hypothetical protein
MLPLLLLLLLVLLMLMEMQQERAAMQSLIWRWLCSQGMRRRTQRVTGQAVQHRATQARRRNPVSQHLPGQSAAQPVEQ